HRGRTVSFCCNGCADAFRAEPDRYLPERATDPVCGVTIAPALAAAFRPGDASAIWLCSTGCAEQWDTARSVPVQMKLGAWCLSRA
ncbi:MAG TPA: hypothetical protein VKQ71_04230, partial [Acidimicrobiales bacterium]|nr:hypothetical protein [Acidimicrobiales bacterium]